MESDIIAVVGQGKIVLKNILLTTLASLELEGEGWFYYYGPATASAISRILIPVVADLRLYRTCAAQYSIPAEQRSGQTVTWATNVLTMLQLCYSPLATPPRIVTPPSIYFHARTAIVGEHCKPRHHPYSNVSLPCAPVNCAHSTTALHPFHGLVPPKTLHQPIPPGPKRNALDSLDGV